MTFFDAAITFVLFAAHRRSALAMNSARVSDPDAGPLVASTVGADAVVPPAADDVGAVAVAVVAEAEGVVVLAGVEVGFDASARAILVVGTSEESWAAVPDLDVPPQPTASRALTSTSDSTSWLRRSKRRSRANVTASCFIASAQHMQTLGSGAKQMARRPRTTTFARAAREGSNEALTGRPSEGVQQPGGPLARSEVGLTDYGTWSTQFGSGLSAGSPAP
jgi:hypothetical protein